MAGFVAQFHDESVCNAELVAVGAQALRELGQASLYHFPVSLRRLPGNVLRVRGAWEDVAKAVAAVHTRIQAAQRQRVEAEVLYGLVKWQHLATAGWHPFNVATNQWLETAYASGERRAEIDGDGQWVEIDLLKAVGVAPGTGAPIRLRREICLWVGIYGQGLYFAVEAARSVDYAKPDAHGHRFMFQVRVLTGQFTQGKEDMVLPPEKPDGGGRYDSVVNMVSRPSIFVTFFDDLTYPEYLITFRGTRPHLN
ncbi:uncharacterized protein LOC117885926 [Trachemys scripta elegans]|uniref:uncharacterized protein LOC117885926 n=1 Tax=Trachemys scripta elegans TaxID=31138 RepID=UPI0015528380|nr:uncharacterized protein LOC117885926 [Trachemys scripta elegans]